MLGLGFMAILKKALWGCSNANAGINRLNELTEACPKANTPDHFFVRNPNVVSSQQLIPLPLIHDVKEGIKEINAINGDVCLQEIFKKLKKDHAGHVPMDQFKYRITNHQTIKFKGWLMYVQLAYKAASLCISFVFPIIRRLLPNPFRRNKERVRQYRIVRQPRQDIELRQRIRPSSPADLSNP